MTTLEVWRVGELARQTGLSVRTLHYYDEIGLLSPSYYTEAGYRLYGASDISRLQRIKSLRQLGFSLEEIRDCLDQPDFSPRQLIQHHIARVKEQIKLQQMLCDRLEILAFRFDRAEEVTSNEFLQVIEVMSKMEPGKYYTPEQMAELKKRSEEIGMERIKEVEAEWPVLIAQVRAEMEAGTDPTDPRMQALAKRWMGLVAEFTGGNPGIQKSLQTMYENEPEVRQQAGLDMEIFSYVGKAYQAAKQS